MDSLLDDGDCENVMLFEMNGLRRRLSENRSIWAAIIVGKSSYLRRPWNSRRISWAKRRNRSELNIVLLMRLCCLWAAGQKRPVLYTDKDQHHVMMMMIILGSVGHHRITFEINARKMFCHGVSLSLSFFLSFSSALLEKEDECCKENSISKEEEEKAWN